MVAVAPAPFAEIGKIKPALAVEHDVVRRRQFVAAALTVEDTHFAGARIDPLDVAALVILRRPGREKAPRGIFRAAVVAEIERAVGPAGEPVRPTAGGREHGLGAARGHASNRTAGNLAQNDRTVGHRDGTFGKPQPRRHHPNIGHRRLPSWYPTILSRRSPERQAGHAHAGQANRMSVPTISPSRAGAV